MIRIKAVKPDEWCRIGPSIWVKASPDFRGSVKVQAEGENVIFVRSKRKGLFRRVFYASLYS